MTSPVTVTRIQNRRGTQAQFDALYPVGYGGIGGFGSQPNFNITNYPEVLLSGELALCTDTRRMFMGNINGEYVEVGAGGGSNDLAPITILLPPAAVFTTIPALSLTILPTPFFRVAYSITDNTNPNWNTVGTHFSRNGELEITAVLPFAPPPPNPPFPTPTPVTLTDTGVEINTALPSQISFQAIYNVGNTQIEIQYMHNFAGSLAFNTSTIAWLPY